MSLLRGGKGGEGLMCRIKIPLQDFALKMQGGLMREGGGIFSVHYGIHLPVPCMATNRHTSVCEISYLDDVSQVCLWMQLRSV